jgi:hypothetical protein
MPSVMICHLPPESPRIVEQIWRLAPAAYRP